MGASICSLQGQVNQKKYGMVLSLDCGYNWFCSKRGNHPICVKQSFNGSRTSSPRASGGHVDESVVMPEGNGEILHKLI